MADIDVQRKSGTPIWPWIVGLLVLALVVWAVVEMMEDEPTVATEEVADAPPAAEPMPAAVDPAPAVQQYAESCMEQVPEEMGLEHQYTVNCLRQLSAALESVAERDPAVAEALQERADEVRQQADRLEASDPMAESHSSVTREAFQAAARAIMTAQQQLRPDMEQARQAAQRAQEIAGEVDPAQPMLEQRDRVQRFFHESAQALRSIDTGEAQPS